MCIRDRIYLVLNALELKIARKMEAEGQSLDVDEDQKLNSLLAVFRFRTPIIRKWRNTLGVFEDSAEVFPGQDPRQFVSLEDIRKAWAYFFSAQITLEFYQYPAHREFVPEGFQASQYLRSIEHFISKKTREAVNHYHLIQLLYLFHKSIEGDVL